MGVVNLSVLTVQSPIDRSGTLETDPLDPGSPKFSDVS